MIKPFTITLINFLKSLWFLVISPLKALLPPPPTIKVTDLLIFPIKSCAGIRVDDWPINDYGLELDRFWMIVEKVSSDEYKFVTQRDIPQLVLIQPCLKTESLKNIYDDASGKLLLNAPGMTEISIDFAQNFSTKTKHEVKVWNDIVFGYNESEQTSDWINQYINKFKKGSYHLFIKDRATTRLSKPRHTPNQLKGVAQTAFADGFPLLLVSEASINELNSRLDFDKQISTLNFRPNIVVSGINAYDEEKWKLFHTKNTKFYVVCRCTRCTMPCNDVKTGVVGKEPTITMMKYRRVDPGSKYNTCFGMNLIHEKGGGIISVGDEIIVDSFTHAHDRKKGIWEE